MKIRNKPHKSVINNLMIHKGMIRITLILLFVLLFNVLFINRAFGEESAISMGGGESDEASLAQSILEQAIDYYNETLKNISDILAYLAGNGITSGEILTEIKNIVKTINENKPSLEDWLNDTDELCKKVSEIGGVGSDKVNSVIEFIDKMMTVLLDLDEMGIRNKAFAEVSGAIYLNISPYVDIKEVLNKKGVKKENLTDLKKIINYLHLDEIIGVNPEKVETGIDVISMLYEDDINDEKLLSLSTTVAKVATSYTDDELLRTYNILNTLNEYKITPDVIEGVKEIIKMLGEGKINLETIENIEKFISKRTNIVDDVFYITYIKPLLPEIIKLKAGISVETYNGSPETLPEFIEFSLEEIDESLHEDVSDMLPNVINTLNDFKNIGSPSFTIVEENVINVWNQIKEKEISSDMINQINYVIDTIKGVPDVGVPEMEVDRFKEITNSLVEFVNDPEISAEMIQDVVDSIKEINSVEGGITDNNLIAIAEVIISFSLLKCNVSDKENLKDCYNSLVSKFSYNGTLYPPACTNTTPAEDMVCDETLKLVYGVSCYVLTTLFSNICGQILSYYEGEILKLTFEELEENLSIVKNVFKEKLKCVDDLSKLYENLSCVMNSLYLYNFSLEEGCNVDYTWWLEKCKSWSEVDGVLCVYLDLFVEVCNDTLINYYNKIVEYIEELNKSLDSFFKVLKEVNGKIEIDISNAEGLYEKLNQSFFNNEGYFKTDCLALGGIVFSGSENQYDFRYEKSEEECPILKSDSSRQPYIEKFNTPQKPKFPLSCNTKLFKAVSDSKLVDATSLYESFNQLKENVLIKSFCTFADQTNLKGINMCLNTIRESLGTYADRDTILKPVVEEKLKNLPDDLLERFSGSNKLNDVIEKIREDENQVLLLKQVYENLNSTVHKFFNDDGSPKKGTEVVRENVSDLLNRGVSSCERVYAQLPDTLIKEYNIDKLHDKLKKFNEKMNTKLFVDEYWANKVGEYLSEMMKSPTDDYARDLANILGCNLQLLAESVFSSEEDEETPEGPSIFKFKILNTDWKSLGDFLVAAGTLLKSEPFRALYSGLAFKMILDMMYKDAWKRVIIRHVLGNDVSEETINYYVESQKMKNSFSAAVYRFDAKEYGYDYIYGKDYIYYITIDTGIDDSLSLGFENESHVSKILCFNVSEDGSINRVFWTKESECSGSSLKKWFKLKSGKARITALSNNFIEYFFIKTKGGKLSSLFGVFEPFYIPVQDYELLIESIKTLKGESITESKETTGEEGSEEDEAYVEIGDLEI